jgi:hypothetical protein
MECVCLRFTPARRGEPKNMWHPNVHGMVNEDERREKKSLLSPSGRAREKYAVNFHMPIWSEKLSA